VSGTLAEDEPADIVGRIAGYLNGEWPNCFNDGFQDAVAGALLEAFDITGQEAGITQVVPVPVLEALASAWEDQAGPECASVTRAETFTDCARMLREAITHGGQG